jgi:hypothetical protein
VATLRSVEYGMPVAAEISRKVIPDERSAAICDEQVFIALGVERKSAHSVKRKSAQPLPEQRQFVTEHRQNERMPSWDTEKLRLLSQPGAQPGDRIRYAIEIRDFTQDRFAKLVGYASGSGLRSLLSGEVVKGGKLHEIASVLQVSYDWIATGKGHPNDPPPASFDPPTATVTTISPAAWPFPRIAPERIRDLDEVELGFLQTEVTLLLDQIALRRRKLTG